MEPDDATPVTDGAASQSEETPALAAQGAAQVEDAAQVAATADAAQDVTGAQAPEAAAGQAEVKGVEWLTQRINQIEASNNDIWRNDLVLALAEDGLVQERTPLGIRLVLDGLQVTSGPQLSDALASWCQVARLAILNEGVV